MINHKQLLTLKTVADVGSYSIAAKKLFITQPAVSLQLKAIEQATGLHIFERTEGELLLTEAGQILYEHASIILNQYESLNDYIKQSQNLKNGTLRIASSTIPGEYLLPQLLYQFKKTHATTIAEIEISDSNKVTGYILNGEYEIGLVGYEPTHKDLLVKRIWNDRLRLIKPKSLHIEPKSVQDIFNYPHILRKPGSGTQNTIDQHLKSNGIEPHSIKPTVVLGSTRAVITAVEAGLGLSWVSDNALKDVKRTSIDVLDESFDIERSFYIITLRKRSLSPLSEHFIQFLSSHDIN